LKPLIFLFIFIFLSSCHPGRIFEEHRKMENYSWKKHQNIVFEFPVEDISVNYDIYIAIRHATQYPYRNLLISTILTTPSGEQRMTDYDLKIRDKDGKPLGDGLGDLWDLNIPLRKDFHFHEAGTCVLEIENRMLKSITPGILEIGLIVEESESAD